MTKSTSRKRKSQPFNWLGILLVVFILLATGCSRGSFTLLIGDEEHSPSHYAMHYERFSGYKEIELEVKENEPRVVDVDVVTTKGTLSAWIANRDNLEKPSYEGRNIPTSTFTVTLSEPGTYTLHVEGDNHTGSFSFSW